MDFVTWLDGRPTSIALRESLWTYPIVESLHTVGIALFIGLLIFWDLRLMGFGMTKLPVSVVWRRLIPWITTGAVLMFATGLLLFYAKPLSFWGNVYFRVKLVILALAGLNALAFHYGIEKRLAAWDTAPEIPLAAKIAGASSMLFWAAAIVIGRFIAYNWYPPLY